jgi:DNA-binding CsgD family transcriptional regulator
MDLRDDIHRLAAGGGDLTTVRIELDRLLRRAVHHDLAAISTLDPATNLWTSCFVSGLPADGGRDRERILFDLEFQGDDVNSYASLAQAPRPLARLHATLDGDLSRARRYGLLLEGLGCTDEMRVMLRSGEACWGSLTLYRRGGPPFSAADEQCVAHAVSAMADLFRLTLLRAALAAPTADDRPPGLLLVAADGTVRATSDAARSWLDAIDDRGRTPSAITALVSAVRAGDGLARAALPAPGGRWIVLHGSSMADGTDEVAVIIEGARPAELAEVIAGAYGFTAREREVSALVAQGRSTKQVAHVLGLSPFTVQDHLKAVFTKVGVQSRGELVATLYARHYEPRSDQGATPGPYGWYLDDNVTAAG